MINLPAFLKTCSHYPTAIFKHDNINYYSSDEDHVLQFNGDLVVNLTKEPGVRAASAVYNIPELKDHMIDFPEELVIGWADFDRPPVRGTFWGALHSYIKNKNYQDVLFHCQQGHGRTGTALSAMLIALKKKSAANSIKEIRQIHCKYAVESFKQIEYLLLLDNELNNRLPPEDEDSLIELITSLQPTKFKKGLA